MRNDSSFHVFLLEKVHGIQRQADENETGQLESAMEES